MGNERRQGVAAYLKVGNFVHKGGSSGRVMHVERDVFRRDLEWVTFQMQNTKTGVLYWTTVFGNEIVEYSEKL